MILIQLWVFVAEESRLFHLNSDRSFSMHWMVKYGQDHCHQFIHRWFVKYRQQNDGRKEYKWIEWKREQTLTNTSDWGVEREAPGPAIGPGYSYNNTKNRTRSSLVHFLILLVSIDDGGKSSVGIGLIEHVLVLQERLVLLQVLLTDFS